MFSCALLSARYCRQISTLLCLRSYVCALMSALFCRALFWPGATSKSCSSSSPTIPFSLPRSRTFAKYSPSSQPALLDHHPVSPFLNPPVTSHLMFFNLVISITAPRLWNDLPSELHTISLHPPPSLPIIGHHFHLAPPGASTQLVYFLPEFCLWTEWKVEIFHRYKLLI